MITNASTFKCKKKKGQYMFFILNINEHFNTDKIVSMLERCLVDLKDIYQYYNLF